MTIKLMGVQKFQGIKWNILCIRNFIGVNTFLEDRYLVSRYDLNIIEIHVKI